MTSRGPRPIDRPRAPRNHRRSRPHRSTRPRAGRAGSRPAPSIGLAGLSETHASICRSRSSCPCLLRHCPAHLVSVLLLVSVSQEPLLVSVSCHCPAHPAPSIDSADGHKKDSLKQAHRGDRQSQQNARMLQRSASRRVRRLRRSRSRGAARGRRPHAPSPRRRKATRKRRGAAAVAEARRRPPSAPQVPPGPKPGK